MKFFVALTLTLLGMFPTTSVFADEITWLQLDPIFRFRDANMSCSDKSDPGMALYFVAIVDANNSVSYADFRDSKMKMAPFLKKMAFASDELVGIKVEKDELGDYWIKDLPLSSRLINWVFFNVATSERFGCHPSQSLQTIDPNQTTLTFTRQSPNSFYSQQAGFSGQLSGGGEYSAKLGFIQRMMLNP